MCEIEQIDVDDLVNSGELKYNSNNHWINNIIPDDYITILNKTRTFNWIDKFKKYKKISIKEKEFDWLIKASKIGKATKRMSNLFLDELESLLDSHSDCIEYFVENRNGYFVRTDNVSLKYGCHGVGPYYDLKSIIESAVSSMHGHSPINDILESLNFYLIEWVNIDPNKEFRVFVHNNKITAISQQHTTKSNILLKNLNIIDRTNMIYNWITILNNYFESTIKVNITNLQSYSIDIALIDNDIPYFIEINPFGKEYAAGSSLFHWLINEEILYDLNNQNKIYFRYAI